jgi:hypothetical protein
LHPLFCSLIQVPHHGERLTAALRRLHTPGENLKLMPLARSSMPRFNECAIDPPTIRLAGSESTRGWSISSQISCSMRLPTASVRLPATTITATIKTGGAHGEPPKHRMEMPTPIVFQVPPAMTDWTRPRGFTMPL